MARNIFIDPAGDRDDYSWTINHDEEDEVGQTRNIERGGLTGDTGLVRQQGDDSPMIIRVRGTILHQAQLVEMKEWYALSRTQTIYFRDFALDEYEVLITSFKPTRRRTIKNPRDYANAPLWYWKYELEMEVIAVRDGVWEGIHP